MAGKRAINHHILPESFIKRFAKNEQIWVTDFEKKNIYPNNINNATVIRDFYTVKTIHKQEDDCIEQDFLSQIESLPGPIIDNIIEKHSLPKRLDWDYLANFIALMYVRGPWFRQIILEVYEHVTKQWTNEQVSNKQVFNEKAKQFQQDTGKNFELSYEEAIEAQKHLNISVDIPRTFYIKTMMEYAASLVPIIYKMTPNLLIAPSIDSVRFVTGDVPIIPISRKQNASKMWINDIDADLYFPISSKYCIVLNYDGLKKATQVSKRYVAFINHLVACNCTRLVLSEEKNFIWMRKNYTISTSSEELVNSWADEKKTQTRAKIPDTEILSQCRNDWKLLKSKDPQE